MGARRRYFGADLVQSGAVLQLDYGVWVELLPLVCAFDHEVWYMRFNRREPVWRWGGVRLAE